MAPTKQAPSVLCHHSCKRNPPQISLMGSSSSLIWHKTCITISRDSSTSEVLRQGWFLCIFQLYFPPSFLQGCAFWLQSPFTQLGSQAQWSIPQILTMATASYWPGSAFASVSPLASSTLFLEKNKADGCPGERVGYWEWGRITLLRELLGK